MNIERGNVRNQFLVSSVLVSLYAVTNVLGQISGPPSSSSGYICPPEGVSNRREKICLHIIHL